MSSSEPNTTAAIPESTDNDAAAVDLGAALLRLLDQPISDTALAAGAASAAKPAESRPRGIIGFLLFRLGDETLAVPAKLLRRTTPFTPTVAIPHRTSGILRGLCNIRGELVLCADLRRMLGLPAREAAAAPEDTASDSRRMVVIGPAEASWAFEVDALIGVERVSPEGFQPPPLTVEHALGGYVTGLTEIGAARISVLDGQRILDGFRAGLT